MQLYQEMTAHLKNLCEWNVIDNARTLAAMMTAVWRSRDVRLSTIADQMPLAGKQESNGQRMRRWLKNPRLDVEQIYHPVARQLLQDRQVDGIIRLQMDRVTIGNRFNVLMVTVAVERRAMPLIWKVLPHQGNSNAEQQRHLLSMLDALMPADVQVIVLADREFGNVKTMQVIVDEMGWDYVLRVKSDQNIYIPGSAPPIVWHRVGHFVPDDAQQVATYSSIKYTQGDLYETNLVMTQAQTDSGDNTDDPWIVATSLKAEARVIDEYARRFGCEPLFSDLKTRGFCWENTRLRHADRLHRLILVLALLTSWMVELGRFLRDSGHVLTYWQPSHVDRYSLFQLGLRWLRKQVTMGRLPPIAFNVFWQFAPG